MLIAGVIASSVKPLEITGGTLYTSGGYNYRVFTSSGTLGVSGGTLTADILVIAGGGGGGYYNGGGGGAGGLAYYSSQTISSNKTITVGAGAPAPAGYVDSSNGNDSTFQG